MLGRDRKTKNCMDDGWKSEKNGSKIYTLRKTRVLGCMRKKRAHIGQENCIRKIASEDVVE
jgi:hypothetical protein